MKVSGIEGDTESAAHAVRNSCTGQNGARMSNCLPRTQPAHSRAPVIVGIACSMNRPWLTTSDWPVSARLEGGETQRHLGDVRDRGEDAWALLSHLSSFAFRLDSRTRPPRGRGS